MAYNPFNIFRRNQKALFAVLVVFIMIMFTLQSGVVGGDAFEMFSRWLGSRDKRDPVCTIDGDKVTPRDVEVVRQRRLMANRFMSLAAAQTFRALEGHMSDRLPHLGPMGQQLVQQFSRDKMMVQFGDPSTIMSLPGRGQTLSQVLSDPRANAEDKKLVPYLQVSYMILAQQVFGRGEHYFLNAPNDSTRDVVEFMLWEKKADELGIQFTEGDVKKMIVDEFHELFRDDREVRKLLKEGFSGFSDAALLRAVTAEFRVRAAQTAVMGLAGRQGGAAALYTPYELFEYYRDQCSPAEYEVIAVPSAAFVDRVVAEPTDEELRNLFTRYKDDEPNPRKDSPGFKEPRRLSLAWLRIKGDEPYYIKLAEEQLAKGEILAKSSGFLTVPVPGCGPAWGMAAAGAMSEKDPAVSREYQFHKIKWGFELQAAYSTPFPTLRSLMESSAIRPPVIAATTGAFLAQGAGFGHPAAAAAAATTAAIAFEVRDRIKFGTPIVLGAMPGPGMMPTLVGGAAASKFYEPKPLSIDAMRPTLMETTVKELAKRLAQNDADKFASALARYSGNMPVQLRELKAEEAAGDVAYVVAASMLALSEPDEKKRVSPAERYVRHFIASRGITSHGASTAPYSEWTIEEDPGLRELVDIHRAAAQKAAQPIPGSDGDDDNEYMNFGRSFFWQRQFDQATMTLRFGTTPSTGLYVADQFPPRMSLRSFGARSEYLVWRTQDVSSRRVTASWQTAPPELKAQVKAAWKKQKAKELAQARADALANGIRADQSASSAELIRLLVTQKHAELLRDVTNPKVVDRVRRFGIYNVCPLAPADVTFERDMTGQVMRDFQGRPVERVTFSAYKPSLLAFLGAVEPFRLEESHLIPYPTPEMSRILVDTRGQPARTVVVLADSGRETFYVATLVKREQKTADEFRRNVYVGGEGGAGARARGVLLNRFRSDLVRKSRETTVELLKRQFKYEETEEQKKKLDEEAAAGRNRF